MHKSIAFSVIAISLVANIAHACTGVLLNINFSNSLLSGDAHTRLQLMTYIFVGFAGAAALFHLPLFNSPKQRISAIGAFLFSYACLITQVVTLTHLRSSLELLREKYLVHGNASISDASGAYWALNADTITACCETWKGLLKEDFNPLFPHFWVPKDCCTVMHNSDSIEECLEGEATRRHVFEKYACFQHNLDDISLGIKQQAWLLFTHVLVGLTIMEFFFYVTLSRFRSA